MPKIHYRNKNIVLTRLKKKNSDSLNKKSRINWNKKNHNSNYLKANKIKIEKNLKKLR